jgi:transposase
MLYANVTPDDAEKLQQELTQTKDAAWYQRLKSIQLSSQGKSVPELHALFERCAATIREYIKRYNPGGIEGLKAGSHDGASPKIPLSKAEWEELLRRSPSQFDQLNTGARNWSQELLVDYVRLYYQVTVDQSTISKTMKRLGLRWNRGALKVTSPDPFSTVKRQRIDEVKTKRLQDA